MSYDGIPGKFISDPTAVDGQRFIASKRGVQLLVEKMRQDAHSTCQRCGHWCTHGDRHHIYGRGFSGSKREDRPVVNGVVMVIWVCRSCHNREVIRSWGSWTLSSTGVLPVPAPRLTPST